MQAKDLFRAGWEQALVADCREVLIPLIRKRGDKVEGDEVLKALRKIVANPHNWQIDAKGLTMRRLSTMSRRMLGNYALHFEDVRKLLEVLHRLVDQGNSVVVIEHNLDVIKTADWLLDLGPEGGVRGGELVAEGTPEQVAKNPRSFTGSYLGPLLKR